MKFTPLEYTDIIVCYGIAGENTRRAARIYAERFPRRALPTKNTILRVVQRMRETACLVHNTHGHAVRRRVQDEERILDAFYENPRISIRSASRELRLSRYGVHRTLLENKLHPYHYQRVQQLLPRDLQQRIHFCEGIVISFL